MQVLSQKQKQNKKVTALNKANWRANSAKGKNLRQKNRIRIIYKM